MTAFVWTVVGWCAVNALGGVIVLAVDYPLERTKGAMALDVLIGAGMVIWGSVLLATHG